MFDDPAVRSVRVALALCERFQELLKGPTTVRAAKQRGALVGVSGDQEGLSMRICEAQQIYPEIWQHLDDARKVFADRGIDTSAFDSIRAQEGEGLGANVGLEQASYGYGSHGVDQQVKTAGFNTQGLGRARSACKALMDATPDIDWKAIAAAEGSDPAAADFARSTRNKRYMRLAALALVIFAPFGIVMYMRHAERVKREEWNRKYDAEHEPYKPPPLADADRTAIKTLIAALRPQLIAAQASWNEVFAPAALESIKPGTAACTRAIQPPTKAAQERYVLDARSDPSFASSDFFAYPVVGGVPNALITDALHTVQSVEAVLAKDQATSFHRASLEAITPYMTIVIIDNEVEPKLSGDTFTPGQVLARSYVYSLRDAKIICAGTIDARNTAPDAFPYKDAITRDLLHREMELRLRDALATGLHGL